MQGRLLKLAVVLLVACAGAAFCGAGAADDGAVRVTFDPANEMHPDWSPDGKQIVFESDRTGDLELFVISLETAIETRITSDPGWDARPAWSRDGSLIAFESDRSTDSTVPGYPMCELFVIYPTGEPAIQVTDWPRYNERPDWSPDGTELVYASDFHFSKDGAAYQSFEYDHPANLWRIPVAGGTPVQVTTDGGYENDVEWSYDGSTLVFSADYSGNWDIWTIPAGGGTATQLTTDPALDQDPTWSPDGSAVAFWSERSGNADIWIVPATGGAATQVTTSASYDWCPSWSPDGTKIAFHSGRDGSKGIYIIDVPGTPVEPSTLGQIKAMFK